MADTVVSITVSTLTPIETIPISVNVCGARGVLISSKAAASRAIVQPPAISAGNVYPTIVERGRFDQSLGLAISGFFAGIIGVIGMLDSWVMVGVMVGVLVAVMVGVFVGVIVIVVVGVLVDVLVEVAVGVSVGVLLGVFVGVLVAVGVGVLVGVLVGVDVGVLVGVWVEVAVSVFVGVLVGVLVGVFVGVTVVGTTGKPRGTMGWIMIFTARILPSGTLFGATTVTNKFVTPGTSRWAR